MPRTGVALVVLALASPTRIALADSDDELVAVETSELASHYPETCSHDGGIVGRRSCPPYGMWGAALESPYVLIRIGVNMRRLARAPGPAQNAAAERSSQPTPTPLPPDIGGADDSYSIAESINIATSQISYIGFEVEISPTADENLPAGARTFAAGAQLLFGLHGGTHFLKLGAELAAGYRVVDTKYSYTDDEPVLEARAHGDLWLTPWLTAGAMLGTSVLDRGEWVSGIQLGFHTYAYGGM